MSQEFDAIQLALLPNWTVGGTDLHLQEPIKPVVEPMDTFNQLFDSVHLSPHLLAPDLVKLKLGKSVSHRQWQTDLPYSQGRRGTCWAFAGIAALEAAYARQGIRIEKLSEQYLFHITKTWGGVHSLFGGGGNAGIVRGLSYWYVPLNKHAPYIDQPALQALASSIPETGGAVTDSSTGTRDQSDWYEFDLRNIPLNGRWGAQYSVAKYGQMSNFTVNDVKLVLQAGYDVVVDVYDKLYKGGHCILIYGFDDNQQQFLIKNSQSLPGFETMKYTNDPHFDLDFRYAYYITEVRAAATQWAAMWIGRWETDHDGWRGRLIMRKFLDIQSDKGVPAVNEPIYLGDWYGDDGRILAVNGGFVDGGRGMHCTIGDQPFELYLHTRNPYKAGGRCKSGNTWYGVVLSRGTAVGAGSGFDRTETVGLWDTVHDGWYGQMRIGVDPSYRKAEDGAACAAWMDPAVVAHQVDMHVDFGGDNRNQHFQLLHHTWEDGLIGGVTQWSGHDYPVEGRMSPNFYVIGSDGKLNWYRHLGRYNRTFEWDPQKEVGVGWSNFKTVFGGGDGVIYVIQQDGTLQWYYHDGRNQGQFQWQGPKKVGIGWDKLSYVFAGDGGVIYGVEADGTLQWYRHLGRRDGSFTWIGPRKVGTGWGTFTALCAGPDGVIYGKKPDGSLMWYRHLGYDHGYPIWSGPAQVGKGWQSMNRIWAAPGGFIYGRNDAGELWTWRHKGYLNGSFDWSESSKVGIGWGGANIKEILLT